MKKYLLPQSWYDANPNSQASPAVEGVKPERIQRKRIKGWRMPANTVYVGRPTKWGNPFKVGVLTESKYPVTKEQAKAFYRERLEGNKKFRPDLFEFIVAEPLRGKNLCCWCKLTDACHADVLLAMVQEKYKET